MKLLKMSAVALLIASNAQAAITIEGCSAFTEKQIQEIAGKATNTTEAAKLLADAYKQNDYLFIDSNAVNKNLIVIHEKKQTGNGKYAKYFASSSPATLKKINLAAQRLAAESRVNGENVAVNFKQATDSVDISTTETAKKDFKQTGAAVVFSNYGQKYSGQNVGTVYGFAKPGHGQVIEATASHGFKDSDSKGGDFNAGSLTYRKYSWMGETTLRGGLTAYTTGGEYRDLDISGDVRILSLEQAYLFDPANKLFGSISYNNEKKTFGIADADDQLINVYAQAGLRGDYPIFTYEVSIKQGLSSQRNYNLVQLLGNDGTHFTTLNVESELRQPLKNNFMVSTKLGAQTKLGNKETPLFAQAYAGGLDRGRAYNAGFDSSESGAWGSLVLSTPTLDYQKIIFSPYFGLDGFYGTKSADDTLNAYSAFVGSKVNFGKAQADVGLAKKIGSQSQTGDEYKFVATASLNF